MSYYSRRIDELEKRKNKLMSQMVADKLSLKAINDEIKKCDDAIQRLGEPTQKEFMVMQKEISDLKSDILKKDEQIKSLMKDIDKKDLKIFQLNNTLDRVRTRRKNLSEENSKLKQDLMYAKKTISNLEQKLLFNNNHDDVILAENFGSENIFNDIIEKDKHD